MGMIASYPMVVCSAGSGSTAAIGDRMRRLRHAGVTLAVVAILLQLTGCFGDNGLTGCSTPVAAKLRPSKIAVQPGEKVTFRLPSEAQGLQVAWKTDAYPSGGRISQDGVFTAPNKPDLYRVSAEYRRADGTDVSADAFVSVEPPDVRPEESTAPSEGVSFSVDEPSGVETAQPGVTGTLGGAFAGTYNGTLSLAWAKQTAVVPFTFTVDSAGGVSGHAEHSWKPWNTIKNTTKIKFSGTVSSDGQLTASGTATSSGTRGGGEQPFSSKGAIRVGGKITGTRFAGGFDSPGGTAEPSGWNAERQ